MQQSKPEDKSAARSETLPTAAISRTDLRKTELSEPIATPSHLGRFAVRRLLGTGGQGRVFLARDPLLERDVAIKVTTVSGSEALAEGRFAARLDHPNVCRVYDLIENGSEVLIVMELVEGTTLQAWSRNLPRPLPSSEWLAVLRIFQSVVKGLHAAHSNNILHQDLKTENVLLSQSGSVKVTDFGVARLTDTTSAPISQIRATARCMAPERIDGKNIGPAADLFSLGVLFYEVLSGRTAFAAASDHQTLLNLRTQDVPNLKLALPELPLQLVQLTSKLLAKDPAQRPQSAEHVQQQLDAVVQQLQRTEVTPAVSAAGKRVVAVISCDLRRKKGDEDVAEIVSERQVYRQTVEKALEASRCHVLQSVGDHYLLVCGFPVPEEKIAWLACSLAQSLQREFSALSVQVGVGVDCGWSLVYASGGEPAIEAEQLGLRASKLSQDARAGAVRVSSAIREALGTTMTLSEPHDFSWQGSARHCYELIETAKRQTQPLDSFFVARQEERSLLLQVLKRANQGQGQLLVLRGEPGIGKSAMVQWLARQVQEHEPDTYWATTHGEQHWLTEAHLPLRRIVEDILKLDDLVGAARRERTEQSLKALGMGTQELPAHLTTLIGLPPNPWEATAISPIEQREALHGFLVKLLIQASKQRPMILVLEDLHWFDSSTLKVISELVRYLPNERLLVLGTARTEFSPSWNNQRGTNILHLAPLDDVDARILLGKRCLNLNDEEMSKLVSRAEGVPLYLGHVRLQLAAQQDCQGTQVPESLAALFSARLHAIGEAGQLAQLASVVGCNFDERSLFAMGDLSLVVLRLQLSILEDWEIIEPVMSGTGCTWRFRHALIRDAAYSGLLKAERKHHHRALAGHLQRLCGQDTTVQQQTIAHHLEQANDIAGAVTLWIEGAEEATRHWALQEASTLYSRALELISELPAGERKTNLELTTLAQLGQTLQMLLGYTSPEVIKLYERASSLFERETDVPFVLVRGLWTIHVIQGDKPRTLQDLKYMESLRRKGNLSPLEMCMAHTCWGTYRFFCGEPKQCFEHYAKSKYSSEFHHQMVEQFGGCGGALTRIMSPLLLALTGALEKAQQESTIWMATVQQLNDPYSLVTSQLFEMMLARELGDQDKVFECVEQMASNCHRYGFHHLDVLILIARSWADARVQGKPESLAAMQRGLDLCARAGAKTPLGYWHCWLGQAQLEQHQWSDALQTADNGLNQSATGLYDYYDAELLRLRALALQGRGRGDDCAAAQKTLEVGLRLARSQNFTLFEERLLKASGVVPSP